eukprot:jgi/Botrbrau1/15331/Bobra.0379s0004.2
MAVQCIHLYKSSWKRLSLKCIAVQAELARQAAVPGACIWQTIGYGNALVCSRNSRVYLWSQSVQ